MKESEGQVQVWNQGSPLREYWLCSGMEFWVFFPGDFTRLRDKELVFLRLGGSWAWQETLLVAWAQ